MSGKSARRRRRDQHRLRALDTGAPDPQHVACADSDLAWIDGLLDDALDAVHELAVTAAQAREGWPATTDTDELRAVLDAVRNAAGECRTRLTTARDDVTRLRDDHHHLHVAGGRIVRMAPVEGDASGPDDDIPF
jgi:hypothetical protein